ncbi:hypothetical protein HELRODRAFT_170586 [Helobdella robusta]|uniref:Uncharacterized protein n=1 Tax=Helobdella robusta TaxID=6412 RepID=T1F374_HELRO|nr:hypothetical protein HELRODRAFT_170586 [Helobdella robusta]ESO07258.1 hypothetical protein HELRODRAFT_170586 [Helobdella robusta]
MPPYKFQQTKEEHLCVVGYGFTITSAIATTQATSAATTATTNAKHNKSHKKPPQSSSPIPVNHPSSRAYSILTLPSNDGFPERGGSSSYRRDSFFNRCLFDNEEFDIGSPNRSNVSRQSSVAADS